MTTTKHYTIHKLLPLEDKAFEIYLADDCPYDTADMIVNTRQLHTAILDTTIFTDCLEGKYTSSLFSQEINRLSGEIKIFIVPNRMGGDGVIKDFVWSCRQHALETGNHVILVLPSPRSHLLKSIQTFVR